eukprot:NODE_2946_length_1309_cov_105.087690_g2797_i0.p1 GENE.NODE_2946_length_1309_cov_105.087690_g2797_i0~~NODE_2946_length_1309_cov_105.087690_g2797_i0.p1  ORF type:complete len:286 (+),score=36.67 NODE_2946_length_1309_cov_105.087690_g2797_i0:58-915(+)
MKFLECANLSYINSLLDDRDVGDCILSAQVEAWSCKPIKSDRKLSHQIEKRLTEEDEKENDFATLYRSPSLNPSESPIDALPFNLSVGHTPGSDTPSPISKDFMQEFTYLVLTLNHSYNQEFDFSTVPREDFRLEENLSVIKSTINAILGKFTEGQREDVQAPPSTFKDDFWQALNEVAPLTECEYYTYLPEEGEDPMEATEEGMLWSKYYFFHHKKAKKMILFRCCARSKRGGEEGVDYIEDQEEDQEPNLKNISFHFGPRAGVLYCGDNDSEGEAADCLLDEE